MRLETFFEKFEQFADAPGAVAKMREIVLDLAVRGRLFGNPADGNAHEIQNSWPQRQLGDVAQFINGDRSKNYPSKSFRVDEGVPFINAGHLSNGDVELTNMDYITTEHFNRLGGGKVEHGDVLYCLRGSLGKCAVVQSIGLGAIASSLLIIRPSLQVISQFIYLFLVSPIGARMIAKYDNGSAQPNLSAANVKKYTLHLPPLDEQKRIVAKVDELMALCDQLEAQQQERETRHAALGRAALARFADAPTPANLDFIFHPSYAITPADLRKSILTLAVQGKLVPQDPSDEPADETLAKVLRDRERQEKSQRIKAPSPVEADAEHTPDLPSGWRYASPDQLTAFHKNALTIGPFGSSLLKSDYTDDGVPLVFVRDIRSETFGGIGTRFVSPDKAEELASHTVRAGDLLITKMGDPPGDTAIYPDGRPPAIITADCIKLTPHAEAVSAEYLRFTIRASQIAEQFAGITLGVAQQKVSLGRFRCIAVPLPPLAEQRRIVAKVDQLMALVDELEAQLAASRATATNLLAALVAEISGGASDGRLRASPTFTKTGHP